MSTITLLDEALAELCEVQFATSGYRKPVGYFRSCLAQQTNGELMLFVAHAPGRYLGHVKLVWLPDYPPFQAGGIPEIQDLNVLPDYRRQGIGTALITVCEVLAATRTDTIGIGVGLHPGYNAAQRLYPRLGYLLDGNGVHYHDQPVKEHASYCFDDDLVIYFTKRLR